MRLRRINLGRIYINHLLNILGIDSVLIPYARRVTAWQRIARDMPKAKLEAMISLHGLADLPHLGIDILAGKIKGRAVIDVRR